MKSKSKENLVVLILLSLIIFIYLYWINDNINHFVENKINQKIIRIYNDHNKSLRFYYEENYCIGTLDTKGDTLVIGDSISKEKSTAKFKVFRKGKNNKYSFYKEFENVGL
ncbi:MAG: hypothetical protein H7195_11415 [Chryseobacterium sp.]|nr:hypothetical protein [Chryseobacterium sp.]